MLELPPDEREGHHADGRPDDPTSLYRYHHASPLISRTSLTLANTEHLPPILIPPPAPIVKPRLTLFLDPQ